ncbi:hypothetical protein IKF74_01745 [Candidatus Saccharibacteria bacterium]|nr:hypothetical protein [Candidatus Saccharibacteria bacterium]
MKRIFLGFLILVICLSVVPAFATPGCYAPYSSTIFLPQHVTTEVTGIYRTRYDWCFVGAPCVVAQSPCVPQVPTCQPTSCQPDPCAPFMQTTIQCCDNYKRLVGASSKSAEWAKYALKVLKQVIKQTGISWKITKTKLHTPSNNGWVELHLRNSETGEELYCVMNLHTRGNGATSDRVCTFTYGHLINPTKRGKVAGVCYEITPCFKMIKSEIATTGGLRLVDYPDYYIIGTVGEKVETSIAHFVYWLSQDIDHGMSLESLANE